MSVLSCTCCICWKKQSRLVDGWQINVSSSSFSCNSLHLEHVYFVFHLHTLQNPCFNCVTSFPFTFLFFFVGVRCIPRPERIEPSHDTNPSWFPTYSHLSAITACALLFILLWALRLLELGSLLEKLGVTDGKTLGIVLGDVDGTTVGAELGSLLELKLANRMAKHLDLHSVTWKASSSVQSLAPC